MAISTVFTNNRTQAMRLPADVRFPESIKKIEVRMVGQERVIAPAESTWDSFFSWRGNSERRFYDCARQPTAA